MCVCVCDWVWVTKCVCWRNKFKQNFGSFNVKWHTNSNHIIIYELHLDQVPLLQILKSYTIFNFYEDKMKTGILWAQVISAWYINILHFYNKFINYIQYSLIIPDITFKRVMELYLGKRLIHFKGFLTYFKNVFLIYLPFNSYFNNLNSNYYCQDITGNFTFH